MTPEEREDLVETLLDTTAVLVSVAVRTLDAGPLDVTVVQQRILTMLDGHGALSINAIAEALGVDQSTASRHCTRLEKMAAVVRTPSTEDRRSVEVSLTARGRRQVETVWAARRREIEKVLGKVIEPTKGTLADLLRGINVAAAEEFSLPGVAAAHVT